MLPLSITAASPAPKQGKEHQNDTCSCHLPHGGCGLCGEGLWGTRGHGTGEGTRRRWPWPIPTPGLPWLGRCVASSHCSVSVASSGRACPGVLSPLGCHLPRWVFDSLTGSSAARTSPLAPEQLQIHGSAPTNTFK